MGPPVGDSYLSRPCCPPSPHPPPFSSSGTVLEDLTPHSPLVGAEHDSPPSLPLHDRVHRSPPLTVHAAIVPLESLSHGVDRSFVGVPPLRLAAFRRLLDRRSSTAPPEISGVAKDAGHQRSGGAAVYVGMGDGGGGLRHVGEGSNSKSVSRAGSKLTSAGDFVGGGGIGATVQGESIGDWNGVGLQRAGRTQEELEQAGCLVEVRSLETNCWLMVDARLFSRWSVGKPNYVCISSLCQVFHGATQQPSIQV